MGHGHDIDTLRVVSKSYLEREPEHAARTVASINLYKSLRIGRDVFHSNVCGHAKVSRGVRVLLRIPIRRHL